MTHDRGGPALIGAVAVLVLLVDLLYATSHWSGSFPRAFMVGLACLTGIALVALAVRLTSRASAFRRRARWPLRGANIVILIAILASIQVGERVGGNEAAGLLGSVAGLAVFFALYTAITLIRKRT